MILETNNGSLPRRTIEEIITRYQLEPDLRDLFVEGPRDRDIYRWYLRQCGYRDVSVFQIDTVEVTRTTLDFHGFGNGNRARLVALAFELDTQFEAVLQFVRCIADSDFDFILGFHGDKPHLLYTDYTSVDLYTFEEQLLKRVLCLGFTHSEARVESLMESITPILMEMFIIRAANGRLDWGMTLPDFTRCCEIHGSRINFDRDVFVNRCLDSNAKRRDRATFDNVCAELEAVQLSDPRKGIQGDDYFELLGWYLRHQSGWRGYTRGERSIMTVLLPALDDRLLSKEGLFARLTTVFGNEGTR